MSEEIKTKDDEKHIVSITEKQYDKNEKSDSEQEYYHQQEKNDKPSSSAWSKFKGGMRPNTLDDIHSRSKTLSPSEFEELKNADPLKYGKTFLHPKSSIFGRLYDRFTNLAGDTVVFCFTCAVLIAWMIVGIVFKGPDNWQIAMQDGGSIQSYFSDSLLMRQQQNEYTDLLQLLCEFKSHAATYLKIFEFHNTKNGDLQQSRLKSLSEEDIKSVEAEVNSIVGEAKKMQAHTWFDKMSNSVAKVLGSFYTTVIYWIGIFVWIGLGALPYLKFDDEWQLYINTATAVVITFASMFIQNIRKRHDEYLKKSLYIVLYNDAEIDYKLRQITGFTDHDVKEDAVIVAKPLNRRVKIIEYYAHIVGGGLGAFISTCVFTVWLCIGRPMQWSDDWWLIIGTYTGLIGFIDGFTLRSSYYRYFRYCLKNFEAIEDSENQLLNYIHLPCVKSMIPRKEERSFDYRASAWLGKVVSLSWGVVFAVFVVISLIIVASGLRWSTTGQLICNTPTMIVEGFCLLALLEGHNQNNEKLRIMAHNCLVRKMYLKTYVNDILNKEQHPDESHEEQHPGESHEEQHQEESSDSKKNVAEIKVQEKQSDDDFSSEDVSDQV